MSYLVRSIVSKPVLTRNLRFFTTYVPTINFGKHYDAEILPEKGKDHRSSMILLHGVGDCGYYMLPYGNTMATKYRNTSFYAPTGCPIPIVARANAEHIAWFNFPTVDIEGADHCDGILESYNIVKNWVENEIHKGINPNKIVLCGFSQGAGLALFSTLSLPYTLGATILFGGYLPMYSTIKATPEAQKTPIRMYHGTMDHKIPLEFAQKTVEILKQQNCDVSIQKYVGVKHMIHKDMLNDAMNFLNPILSE